MLCAPTAQVVPHPPCVVVVHAPKLQTLKTPVAVPLQVQHAQPAEALPAVVHTRAHPLRRLCRSRAFLVACAALVLLGVALTYVYGVLNKPVVNIDSFDFEPTSTDQLRPATLHASLRNTNRYATEWRHFDTDLLVKDGPYKYRVATYDHSGIVSVKELGRHDVALGDMAQSNAKGYRVFTSRCLDEHQVRVRLRGSALGKLKGGAYFTQKSIDSKWRTIPC